MYAELKSRLKGTQTPLHIPLYNYGHEHGSFTFKSSSPEEARIDRSASQGVVLAHQVEIRKDIKGNVGTEVDGEVLLKCSSVDKIIFLWEDGKFELTDPPQRKHVGKQFRECFLFDLRVSYTAVYTDQTRTTHIKRFIFDEIPLNQQMFLSSGESSQLDLFVEGTPDKIFVKYRPAHHQRINQQYFIPKEVPVGGVSDAGSRLTCKQIVYIDITPGAWWEKDQKHPQGVIFS